MANALVQFKFVDNDRGGQYLVYGNSQYSIKNRRNDTIYWRCKQHYMGCPAKLTTKDNKLIKIGLPVHNHDEDDHAVDVKIFLQRVKKRSRDEVNPIPSIYDEEISGMIIILLISYYIIYIILYVMTCMSASNGVLLLLSTFNDYYYCYTNIIIIITVMYFNM